jgi:hypothetical protein
MGNSIAPGKFITFDLADETECELKTTKANMYAKLKNNVYDTRSPVDTIDNTINLIHKEVENMNIKGDINVRNLDSSKEKISKDVLLDIIKNTDRSGFFARYGDGGRRRRRSEVDMLTS